MVLFIAGWVVATALVLWLGQRGAGWVSAALYIGMIGVGALDQRLMASPGEWAIWVAFGWCVCLVYCGVLVALRRMAMLAANQALRWSRSVAMWALMQVKRSEEARMASGA